MVPDKNQCLGYLMHFEGRGTYDAEHGLVEVTKEEADTHNKVYDEAIIKGLDACPLSKGSEFYFDLNKMEVKTWLGTKVSERVELKGNTVHMFRKGMRFRGVRTRGEDHIFLKRVV